MSTASTASPQLPDTPTPAGWRQSLADGAPGATLLHIERARTGIAGWEPVHRLAIAMTREPVHAHPEVTNLFRGAPAVAYALHTAGHPAYRTALATLDRCIATLIQHRLQAAHHRIDLGQLPQAQEYDLINGLTGLGAYLMHRHVDHELLRKILAYLVRLTQPIRTNAQTLPGWWSTGSPDRRQSSRWGGGHANFGMAHGITGPLALLSATMKRGVIVAGHEDAIHAICAWLDLWRASQAQSIWWPEVISRDELRTQTVAQTGPYRPSWCYGTPGIARAQQLAGLALGDAQRTHDAEQALIGCLTDGHQLARLTGAGLCHGWAGLVHTARRAADDAAELVPAIAAAASRMHQHLHVHGPPADEGFLEGQAGVLLVEITGDATVSLTRPWWDACLLVGG